MKYLAHALLLLLPSAATASLYKYVPTETYQQIEWFYRGADGQTYSKDYHYTNEQPHARFNFTPYYGLKYPVTTGTPVAKTDGVVNADKVNFNVPLKWTGVLNPDLGPNNRFPAYLRTLGLSGTLDIESYDGPYTIENPYLHDITARCPIAEYLLAGKGFNNSYTEMVIYIPVTDARGYTYTFVVSMGCSTYYQLVQELQLEIEKPIMNIDAGDITLTHENRIKLTGYGGPGVRASLTIENPNTNDVQVTFSTSDLEMEQTTVTPTDSGAWTTFYVKLKRKQPGSKQYNINFTARYD